MNNYCFTVNFHKTNYKETITYSLLNLFHISFYVKKIKIDYSMFPVKVVDEDKNYISFKSMVSTDSPFTLKKNSKCVEGISKTKSSFVYMTVLSTENDDMVKNEIEMLPILEKRIRSKIPFRFLYKKKLRDRLKRVINSACP